MRKCENGEMRERHALPHFLILSFPHFRNPIFPHSHITFARPAYQTDPAGTSPLWPNQSAANKSSEETKPETSLDQALRAKGKSVTMTT